MWSKTVRLSVALATSVVALPYCVALIANIFNGWPLGKNKFKRAFHPKKVLALNYAVIQRQIVYFSYIRLYLRWKHFYWTSSADRIIKDVTFNESCQKLDIYRPHDNRGQLISGVTRLPVVVFIYGGTWSSGNKNMYPMLCTQLADTLRAVVVCPNYSYYPNGYLDDMVQDIVDCLRWIQEHIEQYAGDPNRIMLLGHSSGAHLISMTALELALKQLIENPDLLPTEEDVTPSMSISRQVSLIQFDEVYFNDDGTLKDPQPSDNTAGLSEEAVVDALASSGMTATLGSSGSSFLVLKREDDFKDNSSVQVELGTHHVEQETARLEPSMESDIMVLSESSDNGNGAPLSFQTGDVSGEATQVKDSDQPALADEEGASFADSSDEDRITVEEFPIQKNSSGDDNNGSSENDIVKISENELTSAYDLELQLREQDVMSSSQQEAQGLLSAIRVVVGLAGVYDICDHYEYEYWRGVEDVSMMTRAMYGPENFERLSPTVIVNGLPKNIKLPAFHLIHGDKDYVVPLSASEKFAKSLTSLLGNSRVQLTQLPACGHYEICLDLMSPNRGFYGPVMTEILASFKRYVINQS